MKRYFRIYAHFVSFALKRMFEYRVNTFVHSLFFPAWQLSLYGIITIMFNQTDVLAGWNRTEATLLYLVCELFFAIVYFSFFEGGARYFMDKAVRYGELDFILTKPFNPQFLSMFSRPDTSPLLSTIVLFVLFIWYIFNSGLTILPLQWLMFGVMLVLSYLIIYFTTSAYATLSFYSPQARQMIEIIDKAAEYSHYPLDTFAQPVRLFLLTILPIFFFGNVAAAFLVGKGTMLLFLIAIFGTITSYCINKWAWTRGLKHYSSASS